MNKQVTKNFWAIKNNQQFKDLATYFKSKNMEISKKDIQSDLASLLFLDLERRDDVTILDERQQKVVCMNVKRNYMKQIQNEKGLYLHMNKKTNKKVWVQRTIAKAEPINSVLEDAYYTRRMEDRELRAYVNSFLTKKEQVQLFAIEIADDTAELADFLNVSESNARKIKSRLKDKVKKILNEKWKEEVA